MKHAHSQVPHRNPAVDLYRVVAVVLVVVGHWLAACLTYRAGVFGRENPLVDMPWTQWLTWIFQVVPVFFVVAGYANAVSWTRESGVLPWQLWVRRRLTRTLGPTTVYVFAVVVVVAILDLIGADDAVLDFGGWAVAMHLWFLGVYLAVVSVTPLAVAAHRRWGLAVPLVTALAAAAVDLATIGAGAPHLRWLNTLLCWGVLYQLGVAWYGGAWAGRRPMMLTVGAALVLAAVIWAGLYPVSMIGVPGEKVQNDFPPTVAMLAFGAVQAGLVMNMASVVNRMLKPERSHRLLGAANKNVMALYLWHMIPVVVVALIGYPTGLLPQPPLGSVAWWLMRLGWVAILSVVAAALMTLVWWQRAWITPELPTVTVPLPVRSGGPVMLVGTAAAAVGLSRLAISGFAPTGHLPAATVLLYFGGAVLVGLSPVRRQTSVGSAARQL